MLLVMYLMLLNINPQNHFCLCVTLSCCLLVLLLLVLLKLMKNGEKNLSLA